jgi:hypothetical protein
LEYFYGDESKKKKAVICTNPIAPVNWIPVDCDCVVAEARAGRSNTTAGGPINCSADIQRIREKGTTEGADLLCCHQKEYN